MELSELKRYLKAVCDGENSKYMLRESIKQMQNTRYYMAQNAPSAPTQPKKRDFSQDQMTIATFFAVICIILGAIWGVLLPGGILERIISLLGLGFLGLWVGAILGWIVGWFIALKDQRVQYENDITEYNRQTKVHTLEGNAHKNTLSIIDSNIVNAQNKLAEIDSLLNTLYAQNIIYNSFRNQVAVNQIYEYLMMGICDTLEGPNGAYAQYMNDVRAARICDSIDNLRVAMEQGMASILSLQTQLVSLVKETNSLLSTIHYSIESGFNSVCQEIRSSASTQSNIDRKLDEMNRNLQTATYNQYIAASHTNMKQYLRMP